MLLQSVKGLRFSSQINKCKSEVSQICLGAYYKLLTAVLGFNNSFTLTGDLSCALMPFILGQRSLIEYRSLKLLSFYLHTDMQMNANFFTVSYIPDSKNAGTLTFT